MCYSAVGERERERERERETERVCMRACCFKNHVVDSHCFIVQLFYVLLNSKIYSQGLLAHFTNETRVKRTSSRKCDSNAMGRLP